MTVKKLFEWLKANNAKIAFGFKKRVPYISIKCAGARASYKLGEIGELEEALAGLMSSSLKSKLEDADARTQ